MRLFDTHIVVDWSARSKPSPRRPSKDAIWWAAARQGEAVPASYERTRHAAVASLTEFVAAERAAGRRVLVGFDFPFGYPAGVAHRLTGEPTAFALWKWLATRIEDGKTNDNNRYAVATEINEAYPGVGPCWGRPRSWDCPEVPFRARERSSRDAHPGERRIADREARGAKTVWQLAGAGSVGSQMLLGIPALERFRAAPSLRGHVAVWPFEGGLDVPDRPVVLAEVYPSLLRETVKAQTGPNDILDCVQVGVNAAAFASLDAAGGLAPLFAGPSRLAPEQRGLVASEEAWILGLGFEAQLGDAAENGLVQRRRTRAAHGPSGTDSAAKAEEPFIGSLHGTVISFDDPVEPAAP